MSLFDRYQTDEKCEIEGVWITYGDGVELLIARAGGSNGEYKRKIEKFARRHKRDLEQNTLTEVQTLPVFHKVYSETIVLGWRTLVKGKYVDTVSNADGKPMQFNPRNCVRLFEKLPDFFKQIQDDATNLEYFKTANLEHEAKNSSTSSSTLPE